MRLTFSLCRADDSVKAVLPQEAASAAPSSRVTCLKRDKQRQYIHTLCCPRVIDRAAQRQLRRHAQAHLCTAKSDLLPTSTIGTLSLPV